MRILALNAYHGGSHRAFLEGWRQHSRHRFDVWTLPAYKWKWRMRHAAVTFARQTASRATAWDAIFATDMLNVAEFRGMVSEEVRRIPLLVYFHENQLTYPNRVDEPRDLHFAFSNFTSLLAADAAWFNSAFHRDEFLTALRAWLQRMPDHQPLDALDEVSAKLSVQTPGIEVNRSRPDRKPGPLRLAWVARWEHDKGPQVFFDALRKLKLQGIEFRLRICGQSFDAVPPVFEVARQEFAAEIDHWGYEPDRQRYLDWLSTSDLVVSTAEHEFFGIGVLEAVALGCWPLVPYRLAYPEVLGRDPRFFHQGDAVDLAARIAGWAAQLASQGELPDLPDPLRERLQHFEWPMTARRMDQAIENELLRSSP